MKKYISWNVNGIRACTTKGFYEYLSRENPDIIGLQEVKATEDQNPLRLELEALGYQIYWNSANTKKGYSGTAVFTKATPLSIQYDLGYDHHDQEGRVITLEFENHYFITVYTPNSKRELERLGYREEWDRDFLDYVDRLQQEKPVIFCGDLNVAHEEIDLANPKQNTKNAGFTIEERIGFRNILSRGFLDSFRWLHPEQSGAYTWWSNFAQSRSKNIGWRIDYMILSRSLESRLTDAFIHSDILGSDHCPVGILIDL